MSGINRVTPYFNGAFTIVRTGNSNGCHVLIMNTAMQRVTLAVNKVDLVFTFVIALRTLSMTV